MKEFNVVVTRIAYAEYRVEAESKKEAEQKALEMAYNDGDWNRKDADYVVDYNDITELKCKNKKGN